MRWDDVSKEPQEAARFAYDLDFGSVIAPGYLWPLRWRRGDPMRSGWSSRSVAGSQAMSLRMAYATAWVREERFSLPRIPVT